MNRIQSALITLTCLCFTAVSRADGLPRKGALGVAFVPISSEIQQKYNLKPADALMVDRTIAHLTGERAGLHTGDIVLAFNDKPVAIATIVATVRTLPVGATVSFTVLRDGKRVSLSAPLLEKPRDPGNEHFEVVYSDVLSNGNRMRTIISKPKTPGKHPALMFIQGYSPVSYDAALSSADPDLQILFDFANRGFVTMRVDKPGVGDSEGGPFAQLDYTTELDIYRQALKQLKALDDVDPDNVFIFGHSMGGAFGPMVACEIPVKGLAMYGICARTWHEYFLDILRYQNLLSGASYGDVDDTVRQGGRILELVFQDDKTPEQVKKDHPDLAPAVDRLFPDGLFTGKTARFWKQLENINFASYWAKCNAHVLAVHGQSDYVTYPVDHQLVADIVNSVHPGWGKFETAPSSDHLFWNWPTEAESMKHFPAGTFSPAFLNLMKTWIADLMQQKA